MVSICIPTYNNPRSFQQCLDSVLMQDYHDYEVIVSDDSTDNRVKQIVENTKNVKIRYYHNAPSLGSPANWNNAILLSTGELVKILHHDDHFHDAGSLRKFVMALEKDPSAMFAFSYAWIYYKDDDEFYLHKQTGAQIKRISREPEFLFFRNVIGNPSTTIFRRAVFEPFDNSLKWLVDVKFYISLLKKHSRFVAIPEGLVVTVDGEGGQITRQVSSDSKIVLCENIGLFADIFKSSLDRPKALLYFEELFERFSVTTQEELEQVVEVPGKLKDFISRVFEAMPKDRMLKKIRKRFLTSRYNKRIFQIERF